MQPRLQEPRHACSLNPYIIRPSLVNASAAGVRHRGTVRLIR